MLGGLVLTLTAMLAGQWVIGLPLLIQARPSRRADRALDTAAADQRSRRRLMLVSGADSTGTRCLIFLACEAQDG